LILRLMVAFHYEYWQNAQEMMVKFHREQRHAHNKERY
jgi:hypothetical protein